MKLNIMGDMEWGIYCLNGCGIYGKVSYSFRVIHSKSLNAQQSMETALSRMDLLITLPVSSLPFLVQLRRNCIKTHL